MEVKPEQLEGPKPWWQLEEGKCGRLHSTELLSVPCSYGYVLLSDICVPSVPEMYVGKRRDVTTVTCLLFALCREMIKRVRESISARTSRISRHVGNIQSPNAVGQWWVACQSDGRNVLQQWVKRVICFLLPICLASRFFQFLNEGRKKSFVCVCAL